MKKFMKVFAVVALMVTPFAFAQNPNSTFGGNIGAGGSFPLLYSSSVSFTSDANHTMVYPETAGFFIKVTSSVSLTATRNLVAPIQQGFIYIIENATTGGQGIQIIGSTGAGVTVANGAIMSIISDGTNYASANPSGGGMVYCGVGICNSTGSAYGTSYSASNTIPANFISTLNQNTTGSAASLSAASVIPNGTTATTQTPGTSNNDIATMNAIINALASGSSQNQIFTSAGQSGTTQLSDLDVTPDNSDAIFTNDGNTMDMTNEGNGVLFNISDVNAAIQGGSGCSTAQNVYQPWGGNCVHLGTKQIDTISSPLAFSTGTLSIAQASTSVDGYLSHTDWNTFNGKASASATFTLGGTSISLGGTTTTVTGLTLDGVSPTTFGFLDPTSSVQTQLNNKAPSSTVSLTDANLKTALHSSSFSLSGCQDSAGEGFSGIALGTHTPGVLICDSSLTYDISNAGLAGANSGIPGIMWYLTGDNQNNGRLVITDQYNSNNLAGPDVDIDGDDIGNVAAFTLFGDEGGDMIMKFTSGWGFGVETIQIRGDDGSISAQAIYAPNIFISESGFGTNGLKVSSSSYPFLTLLNTSSNAAARNWVVASSYASVGDFAIAQSTAKGGDPTGAGVVRFGIAPGGDVLIGTTTDCSHILCVNGTESATSYLGTWAGARLTSSFIPTDTAYVDAANVFTTGQGIAYSTVNMAALAIQNTASGGGSLVMGAVGSTGYGGLLTAHRDGMLSTSSNGLSLSNQNGNVEIGGYSTAWLTMSATQMNYLGNADFDLTNGDTISLFDFSGGGALSLTDGGEENVILTGIGQDAGLHGELLLKDDSGDVNVDLSYDGSGSSSFSQGAVNLSGAGSSFDFDLVTTDGSGHMTMNTARMTPTTVSGLPTCNGSSNGTIASVTDSSVSVWGTTVAGGGSGKDLVYCNGAAWTVAAK